MKTALPAAKIARQEMASQARRGKKRPIGIQRSSVRIPHAPRPSNDGPRCILLAGLLLSEVAPPVFQERIIAYGDRVVGAARALGWHGDGACIKSCGIMLPAPLGAALRKELGFKRDDDIELGGVRVADPEMPEAELEIASLVATVNVALTLCSMSELVALLVDELLVTEIERKVGEDLNTLLERLHSRDAFLERSVEAQTLRKEIARRLRSENANALQ